MSVITSVRPLALSCVVVAVWLSISVAPALGYTLMPGFGSDPRPPLFRAYDWDWTGNLDANRSSCDAEHYPDQPVHAFRDTQGRIQMIMANGGDNRRMVGGIFPNLKPEQQQRSFYGPEMRLCDFDPLPPNPGQHADNNQIHDPYVSTDPGRSSPESFHNREWIDSTWTPDGQTIYALVHNEYHGDAFNNCAGKSGAACYYSSITSAVSSNVGAFFDHPASPPGHLVASIPYQYTPGVGAVGYASPTNIVSLNTGGWIAVFIARSTREEELAAGTPASSWYTHAQETGPCLMETVDITNPKSWKAWNLNSTSGWSSFVNPYDPTYNPTTDPPSNHVCTPLRGLTKAYPDPDHPGQFKTYSLVPRSLTFNTSWNRYMLVGTFGGGTTPDPLGIYYSVSAGLDVTGIWSTPQPILLQDTAPNPNPDCFTYPSLIDPTPPSVTESPRSPLTAQRNFETVNRDEPVYLYLTRNNTRSPSGGCGGGQDRDLMRLSITLPADPLNPANPSP